MKMKLEKIIFWGILFTSVVGTLMHFVYDWSGNNKLVGYIAPVNESTWEHLKLLFWPMLIYCVVGYFLSKKRCDYFWVALFKGLVAGLLSIIIIFYTYSGILGTNVLWMDILLFYISVVIAFLSFYRKLENPDSGILGNFNETTQNRIAQLGILLLIICFINFTNYPPDIGLFISK